MPTPSPPPQEPHVLQNRHTEPFIFWEKYSPPKFRMASVCPRSYSCVIHTRMPGTMQLKHVLHWCPCQWAGGHFKLEHRWEVPPIYRAEHISLITTKSANVTLLCTRSALTDAWKAAVASKAANSRSASRFDLANQRLWARFTYMKLTAQNAARWRCVGAVAVCLKWTSYLLRLQLIWQSAHGTAYKPHFVKEAGLEQRSWNMCLVHCISSLREKCVQCRTKCVCIPAVMAIAVWIKCEM